MKVTLLGTGTPGPNPERAQSAVLIEIGSEKLLFDAGGGTVRQLARAGADIVRVNPVFLTHHHFDHISDLFDVMIMTAFLGRTNSLRVYGPAGTEQIVRALLEQVFDRDIRSRIAEADRQKRLGFEASFQPERIGDVVCRDTAPGVVCATNRWRVLADMVHHGDFADDREFNWCCLGYRIEAEGKVVTISGDTVPCDGIVGLARDADLLVQCCHLAESQVTDPAARYVTEHSLPSSGQVGKIAAEAAVKRMVLTHISMNVVGADMLAEMRRDVRGDFDGIVDVGEDLAVFDL